MADDSAYIRIAENYDRNPVGAPRVAGKISGAFINYLKLLFTPEEAEIVKHLKAPSEILPTNFIPGDYMTAPQVAKLSGRPETSVKNILDNLARKNIILGAGGLRGSTRVKRGEELAKMVRAIHRRNGAWGAAGLMRGMAMEVVRDLTRYGPLQGMGLYLMFCLPPVPMLTNIHAFYEHLMPGDLEAAKIYQEYFINEGYYKYYESSEAGTPVMRVVPVMRAIEDSQRVLDTEEAHRILEAVDHRSLVPCPCRTRTEKMGTRECRDRNPVGSCIMLGFVGLYFESNGQGRPVTAPQAKKYLDEMQDRGLVALTDNFSDPNHAIICLCCDCCCSQVRGRTRWDNPRAMAPSNFVPQSGDDCTLCGKCVERCVFGAIHLDEEVGHAVVDEEKCIGCGVCTITCDQDIMKLHRVERSRTPQNSAELSGIISRENRHRISDL